MAKKNTIGYQGAVIEDMDITANRSTIYELLELNTWTQGFADAGYLPKMKKICGVNQLLCADDHESFNIIWTATPLVVLYPAGTLTESVDVDSGIFKTVLDGAISGNFNYHKVGPTVRGIAVSGYYHDAVGDFALYRSVVKWNIPQHILRFLEKYAQPVETESLSVSLVMAVYAAGTNLSLSSTTSVEAEYELVQSEIPTFR